MRSVHWRQCCRPLRCSTWRGRRGSAQLLTKAPAVSAFLLVALSPLAVRLDAQTTSRESVAVAGKVHDDRYRLLAGVEVIVNRQERRAITDSAGRFTIIVTPADSTIGFRRIGYRPVLLSLKPPPPTRDTVLVMLVQSPVDLPDLIVTAAPVKPLRYAGTTKYDEFFLRGVGRTSTASSSCRRPSFSKESQAFG